jgi:hypothetical protein
MPANDQGVVLFEDIASLRPETAPGAGPAPSVDRALREVLGASATARDPAGFLASLERSFTIHEPPAIGTPADDGGKVAGTVVSRTGEGRVLTWTPRGYALQADLGALSGAQASLYRRAQQALEAALPLIAGLEPLIPYEDEEALTAQREVIRSELQRVVQELGSLGGPSVGLVDQLLTSLVGVAPANAQPTRIDAEEVGGHLNDLREHFGLKRELINTLEEEQNFTNFLVLSDYVTTLFGEWVAVRDAFTGAPGGEAAFFGTQLVLISRELQVASESVHEVVAALDAVLIGPSERQTLSLSVAGSQVFLGQLLDWADRLLTVDAPQLIETAGREGAFSLEPTLTTLQEQVTTFADAATALPEGFPTLFRNLVVQSTLRSLSGSLSKLVGYIQDLGPRQPVIGFPLRPPAVDPWPPELQKVTHQPCSYDGRVRVIVEGDGLEGVGVVARQQDGLVDADVTGGARRLEASIDLGALAPGETVWVLTRSGAEYAIHEFDIG